MGSGSTGHNPKNVIYNPNPTFNVPRTDNKARRQEAQRKKEQKADPKTKPQKGPSNSETSEAERSVSMKSSKHVTHAELVTDEMRCAVMSVSATSFPHEQKSLLISRTILFSILDTTCHNMPRAWKPPDYINVGKTSA